MECWLIVEEGIKTGGSYRLKQEIMTIGRNPANPIQIVDTSVSRHHAQMKIVGHRYYITDLSSRNGTFVNQRKVTEGVPLRNGDIIQLGDVVLLYLVGKGPRDQPDLVQSWKKASETTRITKTTAMKSTDLDIESETTEEIDRKHLKR